jgi:hypothetical protein
VHTRPATEGDPGPLRGHHSFPGQPSEVRLIGDGIKQEAVGRRLGSSRSTVASHLTNIRRKYSDSGLPYSGAADYRDWAKQQRLDRDRHDPTKDTGPES